MRGWIVRKFYTLMFSQDIENYNNLFFRPFQAMLQAKNLSENFTVEGCLLR
jgi:hypothetical protein